ncbi:MAG TPA: site-specific DNA-methyltransferase [Anaerovoracaceae bacterium]|nr:site-specific DNA-methyltransferase [Anaerovoracaceae bacterium]
MSIIQEIGKGLEIGLDKWNDTLKNEFIYSESHSDEHTVNSICLGDNLEYMKWLLKIGYKGKIQLIYIDPPFFTKAKYDANIKIANKIGNNDSIKHIAYDDLYDRDLVVYSENISARLMAIKELLSETGLVWVHLDWHSSHYVKIILDEIFGASRFENEIIWNYKSGGTGKRHFSRKHDTLLVYSKSKDYYLNVPKEKSYNRGLKPYRFKNVKEYRDEMGWYTMVNMKDVWFVDMVGRTSNERNGYATQKPEALLERIIEASTNPGDLCADFFCGSGTMLSVASKMGRNWIGCDREKLAIRIAKKRLDKQGAKYYYYRENSITYLNNNIDIRYEKISELEDGKHILKLKILKFKPEINMKDVFKGDRDKLKLIMDEDSKKLIDYVIIDNDYDGNLFHRAYTYEMAEEIIIVAKGEIAMIAVDIFGNEYFEFIKKEKYLR